MSFSGWMTVLILLNLIVLSAPPSQTQTTFKVGAWGDDASRNNLGVRAQIQTHSYGTVENTLNYFWIGDDLSDGGFVQFGFSLEPGTHCLKGFVKVEDRTCLGSSEKISPFDARWQWQYWPNRLKLEYYYEIGPRASAGANATVHTYEISPDSSNSWKFVMDSQIVANTTLPISRSSDPVLVVAEGTASNATQPLGPVRFSDLSYFDGGEWRRVEALIAASYCGISVGCAAGDYGASPVGADTLLAGSNVPMSQDGTLLWTNGYLELNVNAHPDVQFIVTSAVGEKAYDGSAIVYVPEGMFAYVSLPDTTTLTPGVLGWLGGQDSFRGWTGSVNSKNLTIALLMDSNKTVTATWNTDSTIPTIVAIVLLVSFAILVKYTKRHREPSRLE